MTPAGGFGYNMEQIPARPGVPPTERNFAQMDSDDSPAPAATAYFIDKAYLRRFFGGGHVFLYIRLRM